MTMVQSRAGQAVAQIALRVPPELRDVVKAAAEASGRSMNSEIVVRLKRAYDTLENEKSGTPA